MRWRVDRYGELRARLWKRRPADEVAEELEHHIAMRTEENVASGMAPEEARAEALRRFGDMERYRRRTHSIVARESSVRRRRELVGSLIREVRLALRLLGRRPAFTAVAVVTLGLGLGATTAIYALLDSVVLRPLRYANAGRLVSIQHPVPGYSPDARWGVSPAGYFRMRERSRTLEDLGLYQRGPLSMSGDGEAERVGTAMVSASLLTTLGARPLHGRLLTPEDDRPNAPRVAVLGYGFWQRRYGGDTGVIGRTVRLDGIPVEVVGVLGPGFDLPMGDADVWIARQLNPAARPTNWHAFSAVARLRDGVTAEAAQAELAQIVAEFPRVFPEAYPPSFMEGTRFGVEVRPLREEVVGDTGRVLWILLGSVGLVLLIACTNVANLFLVRAEARRQEVAIRTALGAGRSQLALQFVTEALLLALVAGLLAVVLAEGGIRLLLAQSPPDLPRLEEVGVRGAAMLFSMGLSVAAGIVFGLAPLGGARGSTSRLREAGRGTTGTRRRRVVRSSLVAAQVALAVMLLAASGLLLRSYAKLRSVELGLEPEGALVFQVTLPFGHSDVEEEEVVAFHRELASRVESLPGVVSAGMTTNLPLAGDRGCSSVFVEGRGEEDFCVGVAKASPGLLEALGIEFRGRPPTWQDVASSAGVATVTRALADRLWPGEDAIGKGIRANGGRPPYYRVVAVTEHIRAGDVAGPPAEMVFFPIQSIPDGFLWEPARAVSVVLRVASGEPERFTGAVRRIVAEMDADVPIAEPQPMTRIVAASLARVSFTLLLLGIAAAMALVISAVGLYGVVSHVAGQRSTEIGIRLALGARIPQVRTLIVRQALVLAAAGVVLGLIGALATTRLLGTLLFDVTPSDPVILVGVSVVLIGIAALASWIPALRASRVDPVAALRAE